MSGHITSVGKLEGSNGIWVGIKPLSWLICCRNSGGNIGNCGRFGPIGNCLDPGSMLPTGPLLAAELLPNPADVAPNPTELVPIPAELAEGWKSGLLITGRLVGPENGIWGRDALGMEFAPAFIASMRNNCRWAGCCTRKKLSTKLSDDNYGHFLDPVLHVWASVRYVTGKRDFKRPKTGGSLEGGNLEYFLDNPEDGNGMR